MRERLADKCAAFMLRSPVCSSWIRGCEYVEVVGVMCSASGSFTGALQTGPIPSQSEGKHAARVTQLGARDKVDHRYERVPPHVPPRGHMCLYTHYLQTNIFDHPKTKKIHFVLSTVYILYRLLSSVCGSCIRQKAICFSL